MAVPQSGTVRKSSGTGRPQMWYSSTRAMRRSSHVWLVVYVRAQVGIAEIKRLPNDAISLEPKGTVRDTLDFQMPLFMFDEDAKLDPGQPKELVFLEIGGAQRELRLPFPTEPFPRASVPMTSTGSLGPLVGEPPTVTLPDHLGHALGVGRVPECCTGSRTLPRSAARWSWLTWWWVPIRPDLS